VLRNGSGKFAIFGRDPRRLMAPAIASLLLPAAQTFSCKARQLGDVHRNPPRLVAREQLLRSAEQEISQKVSSPPTSERPSPAAATCGSLTEVIPKAVRLLLAATLPLLWRRSSLGRWAYRVELCLLLVAQGGVEVLKIRAN
jgi:hypothetical protein